MADNIKISCEACNTIEETEDSDWMDCPNPEMCERNHIQPGEEPIADPHKHLAYPFYLCRACRKEILSWDKASFDPEPVMRR